MTRELGVIAVELFGAGDPSASRLVYGIVIALVVIGVVFVILGIWLFKQTRVDREMLAPLERMGESDWRKRDPATQQRMLDEVRPEGAEPLHSVAAAPSIDADFDQVSPLVASFDDLADVTERDPTPPGVDVFADPPDTDPVDGGDDDAAVDERDNGDPDVTVDEADDPDAAVESAEGSETAVHSSEDPTTAVDRADDPAAAVDGSEDPTTAVDNADDSGAEGEADGNDDELVVDETDTADR